MERVFNIIWHEVGYKKIIVKYFIRILKSYFRTIPSNLDQVTNRFKGRPVFINSLPKSGTHLVTKIMEALPQEKYAGWINWGDNDFYSPQKKQQLISDFTSLPRGCYLVGHVIANQQIFDILKEKDYRSVIIIRDPRDRVISLMHHALNVPEYRFHDFFKSLKSDKEKLRYSIKGVEAKFSNNENAPLDPIDKIYESYLDWFDQPFNLVVKYEDLVGAHGGGSDELQIETTGKIIQHIGCEITPGQVEEITKGLYSRESKTFRKGQIQAWKQIFDLELKDFFKKETGDLLITLGYEKDNSW